MPQSGQRSAARWAGPACWGAGLGLLFLGVPLAQSLVAAEESVSSQERSDPSSQLFRSGRLPRLRIEIPAPALEVLRAYVYRKGSNPSNRTDVAATVREEGRVYTNVAVHLKGSLGSFRSIDDDKPAFTLNFNKWAGGQRFHGLQKISLNNSVQDPTYISEAIARELFAEAGLPSPRVTHALVELNGRDLGLYVLAEGWNKQFLKRHFKNTEGNLWDSGSAGDITEPLDTNSGAHPEDRAPLEALLAAAQEPDLTNRWARLQAVLDLDRFMNFMAMEVMLAHWDGYCLNKNNYRLFHDRSTDRLIFLPHGLDQMFGVYRMSPTSPITPMMKGLVARGVMQIPEGRRRYLQRLSQLTTNLYDVDRITGRVHELAAQVQTALGMALGTRLQHQLTVSQLLDRIARRGASVREQLKEAFVPLQFSSDSETLLTGWRSSRDFGNPLFRRSSDATPSLEIGASGGRAYGSWRRLVLLEAGDYQLIGKVKLVRPEYGQGVTKGGAVLRVSGDREATPLTQAPDWTILNYDFTIAGQQDVELVCEFRASQGRAFFDASSLKLVRKGRARAP